VRSRRVRGCLRRQWIGGLQVSDGGGWVESWWCHFKLERRVTSFARVPADGRPLLLQPLRMVHLIAADVNNYCDEGQCVSGGRFGDGGASADACPGKSARRGVSAALRKPVFGHIREAPSAAQDQRGAIAGQEEKNLCHSALVMASRSFRVRLGQFSPGGKQMGPLKRAELQSLSESLRAIPIHEHEPFRLLKSASAAPRCVVPRPILKKARHHFALFVAPHK